MKINFRTIFITIVILVLYMPFIQSYIPFILEKNLSGYFEVRSKPEFKKDDYFSGKFQEDYMSYLNDDIPLKATITRVYNQILYSFFNETSTKDVVIGTNGYLYEYPYISEYNGQKFIGKNAIKDRIYRLERINNYIEKMGKKLIIVFAPGKASMFPEFIPKKFKKSTSDSTNYFVFKCEFDKSNLNFVDFRDFFIKYKDTSSTTIMGKLGVHWTQFSAHLASDSIIKLFEKLSNLDIVDKKYVYNEITELPRGTDDDIVQAMNLLWNPKSNVYTYPIVEYKLDNKVKPKVSVIADSYWWTINNIYVPHNQFSEYYFMYYFKHTYDFEKEIGSEVTGENLKTYINNSDYIILMATEANFNWFPYGFIEQFEKVYF